MISTTSLMSSRAGSNGCHAAKFERDIGANDALLARPQDLVFHEAGAKLIGPNGKTPNW